MAFRYRDRVHETTTAGFAGTGAVQLNGVVTSPAGRNAFSVIGNGNACAYLIDDGAGNWEVGIGTYTSGSPNTLSRDVVIANSLGTTALVNFAAGVKDVKCVAPAAHLPQSASALTVSSGEITLTGLNHTVDTEAAAASDDLVTINWGPVQDGQIVSLRSANAARFVYLTNADNIVYPCLLDPVIPTRLQRVGDDAVILAERILLDRKSGAATSYDFEHGISSVFDRIECEVTDLRPTTDVDDLWGRVRDSSYQADAADYEFNGRVYGSDADAASALRSASDSKLRFNINTGNASNEGICGIIALLNFGAASSRNQVRAQLGWGTSASVYRQSEVHGVYKGSQNALDGFRLLFSSGGTSIAAGRAELWGYRR